MLAFLISVTLTCILFFESPCPAQIPNPKTKAANSQSAVGSATGASCWFKDSDLSPNCVLRDGQGRLFVAQNYLSQLDFDSHGLAQVFANGGDRRYGWMYVDRKGRVVISGVPISDNWADSFSDGLVRTVVNEKYGFADRKGKIVITPKYDWASPFKHGSAQVCIGCHETCVKPDNMEADPDCEHTMVTGGEWFKINRAGRVVARVRQNIDRENRR